MGGSGGLFLWRKLPLACPTDTETVSTSKSAKNRCQQGPGDVEGTRAGSALTLEGETLVLALRLKRSAGPWLCPPCSQPVTFIGCRHIGCLKMNFSSGFMKFQEAEWCHFHSLVIRVRYPVPGRAQSPVVGEEGRAVGPSILVRQLCSQRSSCLRASSAGPQENSPSHPQRVLLAPAPQH